MDEIAGVYIIAALVFSVAYGARRALRPDIGSHDGKVTDGEWVQVIVVERFGDGGWFFAADRSIPGAISFGPDLSRVLVDLRTASVMVSDDGSHA